MALPAAIAPTFAVAALKESISLCQSILDYKHKMHQVEVQREQMHRQAELTMHQLTQNYQKNMAYIDGIFSAHHTTIENVSTKNHQDFDLLRHSQQQIDECLKAICDITTPNPIKLALTQSLTSLSQQQNALFTEYVKNTNTLTSIHMATLDSLCDHGQPRTFTDVS